jgi:ubiquinone/menaquinone biosynthesis C-methylase UbiE
VSARPSPGDDAHWRRRERAWQDDVGHALLDKPFELAGAAAVYHRQFARIAAALDGIPAGAVVDVGCGNGHLLLALAARPGFARRPLVGADVSAAVATARRRGVAALKADGQYLPFRDASVAAVVYNGALHHIIEYRAAIADALRVLAPGGRLVLFEPVSTAFSRAMHRLLDPIVFRTSCEYESPIDQEYKDYFRASELLAALRAHGTAPTLERTDFLAYPATGCYAGSPFARRERVMHALLAAEDRIARVPGLRQLAGLLAWRVLIVATKKAATV